MKPGILFAAAAVTAVMAFVLAGCAGSVDAAGAGAIDTESVQVNPQLRILDGVELDVAADHLSASGAAVGQLATLAAGDVVVSSQKGGFLRRVVGLSQQNGTLVLATEPAALDDALIQGGLVQHNDLLVTGDRSAESVINVPPLTINFNELPLFDQGAAGKLALNGSITLHPYLDADLALSWGKVKNFDLVLHGDIDAKVELALTAGGALSKSFSQTIWSAPPVVLTQFIGPVPLVETISVELVAVGEAHAGASGKVVLGGLDATAQLTAGAKYDGSKWTPVTGSTVNLTPESPSLNVALTAGGSVKLQARVAVRFYDLAGPYLAVGPYANVDVTSANLATPTAQARIGLNGDFGGDVSVLGHRIAGFDVQLFDVGKDFSFTL